MKFLSLNRHVYYTFLVLQSEKQVLKNLNPPYHSAASFYEHWVISTYIVVSKTQISWLKSYFKSYLKLIQPAAAHVICLQGAEERRKIRVEHLFKAQLRDCMVYIYPQPSVQGLQYHFDQFPVLLLEGQLECAPVNLQSKLL